MSYIILRKHVLHKKTSKNMYSRHFHNYYSNERSNNNINHSFNLRCRHLRVVSMLQLNVDWRQWSYITEETTYCLLHYTR